MVSNPLERPVRDPLIESYLAEVLHHLPRAMSLAYRLEQRAELAAHLDALVAAHIELGDDTETAVLVALRRFGSAQALGRQLSRQWKRAARSDAPTHALVTAAVVFLGCGLVGGLLIGGLYPGWPSANVGAMPLGACLDLLAPCLIGYYWSRPQSHRSGSLGRVLLAGLLLGALLPLQPEYQGIPALDLFARGCRLMQWSLLGCSTAGLATTLQLLRERWGRRVSA